MEFITQTAVALLTGYLALTNILADRITAFLPESPTAITTVAVTPPEETLAALPSHLGGYVTDILRQSSDYQKAAVIEGTISAPAPLSDPRSAVVNIVCTFTTDKYIRTTTGTGFFIDPRGVILTNAHVAQHLLIAETTTVGDASCIVRSDDPNTPEYVAELLYLPPAWIQANANRQTEKVPKGTGERDYALLYVTNTRNRAPLPEVFPALTIDTSLLPNNIQETAVTAIGYPVLASSTVGSNLPIALATTTISELYTFGSNYADVLAIRGSSIGTGGSSGGPILTQEGKVIGMITTRGNDAINGEGSLRAITLSHIARTIEEETGFSLERNIGGDISTRAQVFESTMVPFLLTFLTNELEE